MSEQHNGENDRSAEEIRREIAETREELGDTVAALAEKTDVKAQARAKADQVKSDVREKVEELKEKVSPNGSGPTHDAVIASNRNPAVTAGVAVAIGLVAIWLIRRRR
jgi:ElaB/YqjD/DUF883 family membrane-anchored ribosome-binding protein